MRLRLRLWLLLMMMMMMMMLRPLLLLLLLLLLLRRRRLSLLAVAAAARTAERAGTPGRQMRGTRRRRRHSPAWGGEMLFVRSRMVSDARRMIRRSCWTKPLLVEAAERTMTMTTTTPRPGLRAGRRYLRLG